MRWTRCRALLDRALLKGEELGGRSLGACSPGKQAMGAGLAPGSQRLRTSSLGAGWGRTLQTVCVQARRGRLAPKKVTKGGIVGNSWCRGASTQPSTLARRLSIPGTAGACRARQRDPRAQPYLGGLSGTLTRKSQARGRLSVGPPPTPQGPLFSIKFKLELLGTLPTGRLLPSPPLASFLFCTISLLTLPLSLSHHLVCTRPCTPPLRPAASSSVQAALTCSTQTFRRPGAPAARSLPAPSESPRPTPRVIVLQQTTRCRLLTARWLP